MERELINYKQALILLFIGIIVGMLLLGRLSTSIPVISHDDGISYLAAMGNEGNYSRSLPQSQWIESRDVKIFWTKTDFFKFSEIRYDLAHGDLHPPLYFWLLHIWSFLHSVDEHSGPQLNIIFYIITTLLIFSICICLKYRPYIATSVSLLWLLNGAIMSVSLETRQYGLLALVASLYVLSLVFFLQKKTNKSLIFVTVSALLGMLTHYHFALLILSSIAYMCMYVIMGKRENKVLVKFVLALGLGGLFFVLLHPDFYLSFIRQGHSQHIFSLENMFERKLVVEKVFHSLLPVNIFGQKSMLEGFKLFVASLLIIYMYQFLKEEDKLNFLKEIKNYKIWLPLILFLGTISSIILLYIYQYSPGHAMSVKYLMLGMPLLFILIGVFINKNMGNTFGVFFLFSVLVFQVLDTKIMIENYRIEGKVLKEKNRLIMPKNIPLVIDTVARGVLPRILWYTENKLKIYVSSQINLIQNPPNFKGINTFLYVSNYSYNNNIKKQKKIIDKFKEDGYVIKSTRWDYTNSKFFLFVKKNK